MKLGLIALRIREADTRFGSRVTGVVDIPALEETLKVMKGETAFVLPVAEVAAPNSMAGDISQMLTMTFGVMVALDNNTKQWDKVGLRAFDQVEEARTEIFSAILGYEGLPNTETPISYVSGQIVSVNRAWLLYQFQFQYTQRVDRDDGVNVTDGLPLLEQINAQYVDSGYTFTHGPDGVGSLLPIPELDASGLQQELMEQKIDENT